MSETLPRPEPESEGHFKPAVDAAELESLLADSVEPGEGAEAGEAPEDDHSEVAVRGAEAVKPVEYKILKSYERGETDEQLRARYLGYTDKLIAKVRDNLAERIDPQTGKTRDTGVTMVFLDKSARPAYWLLDEMWDLYAPDLPRPEIKFANIDREQWQDQTGRKDPDTGTNDVDVNRLNPQVFDDLKNLFADPDHPDKSVFDGRNILIVDETKTTGTTLEIAKQMFEKAFPEAEGVEGHHWMDRPRGSKKTSDVPVWYNSDDARGRGVGDRDHDISQESFSTRQREYWMFLSNRMQENDWQSGQLREEFSQLRRDVLSGKQEFSVYFNEDEDVDPALLERAEHWRAIRRAQQSGKKTR